IEDPVPLAEYLEELDLALEGATPPQGAARAAAIRVARPEDVSGLDLSLVVLCQASDQVLDRGDSVDPVIGPELFARLAPSERPVLGGERRSLLLATSSVLAHAERVAVTFSTHEGTSTLGPSRLALWLAKQGAPFRREPASPFAAGARRTRPLPVPTASARRRAAIEIERQRFYAVPGSAPGPYTGAVGSLEAHVPASDDRPVAVTTLERTLRCGFLGFMSVLRASREDPVGDAIGARERGTLLHGALSAALEATRGLSGTHTPEELEARALEAARAFLEQRGKSPLRRAGLVATLWDVRAILRVTFSEARDVHFLAAEVGFGGRDGWPALALGPFRVSGRADRIDASTDTRRVRVIDYKTNLPRATERELELQPFLYAHKCGVELGAQSVEFAYFGLNRRAPELRTVYEGPVESEEIAEAFARAEAALSALREGRLAPVPASRTFCTRCSARDACRRPLSAPDPNSEGGDP
ncbi:MAG: PD-(D/E)XK nuclease family protein, partial [Pseudomonadota bacterium]